MRQSSLGQQWRGWMGIVSGTLAVMSASISHAAPIESWQYDSNVNLLTFVLPNGVAPNYFLMAQPARIVLDIPNTQMGDLPATQNYSSGAIAQISVSQVQPQLMRVVLQMSPDAVFARGQVKLINTGAVEPGKDRWVLQPLLSSKSVARIPVPSLQPPIQPPGPSQPQLPNQPQEQFQEQAQRQSVPRAPGQDINASSPLTTQGSDLPAPSDLNLAQGSDLPDPSEPNLNRVEPPSAQDYPPGMVSPTVPSAASTLLTPPPSSLPAKTSSLPLSKPQQPSEMDGLAALTSLPSASAPTPASDRPTVAVPPLTSIISASVAAPPPAPSPANTPSNNTPNSITPNGQALSPTVAPGLPATPPQQGAAAAAQPTSTLTAQAQRTVFPTGTPSQDTMPFPAPSAGASMLTSPRPQASPPSAGLPPLPSTPQSSQPVSQSSAQPSSQPSSRPTSQSVAPSQSTPPPPQSGAGMTMAPGPGAAPPLPSVPQSGGQQMSQVGSPPLPTTPQSISTPPSIPTPAPASPTFTETPIQFGQPLPTSEAVTAPATVAAVTAPATIVAMNQTSTGLLVVPAGVVLNLKYAGKEKLKLASGAVPEVLLLQTPIQDASGRTIAPAGSAVLGQFQTDQTGSRFVSQVLSIGGLNFPFVGQSAPLNEQRKVSTGQVLQNSGIGAAAGAILGAFTGGIGALVVGGAAAGAATTYAISPQEAVVEPGAVVPVQLTQELLTSR